MRFIWPRPGVRSVTQATLTRQQFDALVLGLPWQRLERMGVIARACLAHARRKFDELKTANTSAVTNGALRHIAVSYRVERELASLSGDVRLGLRETLTKQPGGAARVAATRAGQGT